MQIIANSNNDSNGNDRMPIFSISSYNQIAVLLAVKHHTKFRIHSSIPEAKFALGDVVKLIGDKCTSANRKCEL